MITKKLEEFHLCLDKQRFYDAHEALEEVWFPRRFEDSNEMRLLKGFINAAVSFELNKRGRKPQSLQVWENYLKYIPLLDAIDSPHLGEYKLLAQRVEAMHQQNHF